MFLALGLGVLVDVEGRRFVFDLGTAYKGVVRGKGWMGGRMHRGMQRGCMGRVTAGHDVTYIGWYCLGGVVDSGGRRGWNGVRVLTLSCAGLISGWSMAFVGGIGACGWTRGGWGC